MTRYVGDGNVDYKLRPRAVDAEERRRAALAVAARARDVEDCRALLLMLGLLTEH